MPRQPSSDKAECPSRRTYIVGTAMNTVASASRAATAAGSKRENHTIRLPFSSAPWIATKSPCTWKIGSACSSTSPGLQPHASCSIRALLSRLPCESIAPLLRPVVPLV